MISGTEESISGKHDAMLSRMSFLVEKCIQISTNMPSIGLVIPEINCEMLAF